MKFASSVCSKSMLLRRMFVFLALMTGAPKFLENSVFEAKLAICRDTAWSTSMRAPDGDYVTAPTNVES